MQVETFKDLMAGFQSLVIAIAVMVGGIWTAATYVWQHTVDEARAKTSPSLSLAVDVKQLPKRAVKAYRLVVEVSIDNTGGRDIVLDLSKEPLTVALIKMDSGSGISAIHTYRSNAIFGVSSAGEVDKNTSQQIEVHSKKCLPFYVEVADPGTYLVSFGATSSDNSFWLATKVVDVDDSLPASAATAPSSPMSGRHA